MKVKRFCGRLGRSGARDECLSHVVNAFRILDIVTVYRC